MNRRVSCWMSLALLAAGCGGAEIEASDLDDSSEAGLVLEGASLDRELSLSPAHRAAVPFARLGVLWDAPAPAVLEVSTSTDGRTWSPFRPVEVVSAEVEQTSSFVGQLEAPGARFFRVRAPGGGQRPTFVRLQPLGARLGETLEQGDEAQDGIGTRRSALTVGGVSVHSRASWGAQPPRCASGHAPYRMTIHHTVTPTMDSMSPEARLRQIQSFHMNVQGWCDIGYHFLVSRDGRLWEGRPAHNLGTHVANHNSGNVGIAFMGDYSSTPPTDRQIDEAARLVAGIGRQFGIAISSERIKGHRDYNATSCPGDALYARLPTIISRARQGGTPPPPPPGRGVVKGIIYRGTDPSERLAGATVTLGGRSTTSNANGYYELRDVEPGTHTITAQLPGYAPGSVTRVVNGGEVWGSIGLWPLASGTAVLQGVIYTGGNSAHRVPFAQVRLSTGHTTTADDSGFYRLSGLPPGPVTITASKSGYAPNSIQRTLQNGTTVWGSVPL
ncbi:MAG: N-acetylmuramoyl-L-alanine amidase [Myxococcales bacterium]|nr:N-acetylmuramoyl-L-alanine amidase [Myxococcota bacterium]MDW8283389.1 N-acetylmuramoyl-L-alanine amidase [Myxococcales bacterium]